MIYSVKVLDDGEWPTRQGVDALVWGTVGKPIGLADICDQFNYTVDEDETDQIGYTPRVELGPKVSF